MLSKPEVGAIFRASAIPYLIVRSNPPRFTIAEVNSAFLKATGTEEDDLLGKSLFEAFPGSPDEQVRAGTADLRASLEQVLSTKKPHQIQVIKYDIPTRGTDESEERYWRAENIPVLDAQGEIDFIIHLTKDITDRILSEKSTVRGNNELQEKTEHYRSLFEHNPDAVYSFDLRGNFLSANKAAADLTETTVDKLLDLTFLPFIANEDKDRVFDHFLRASEGQIQHYECQLITAKGNRKNIKVTNMPIIVGDEIVGVYGIAKDITERQEAKQRLELAMEGGGIGFWSLYPQRNHVEFDRPLLSRLLGYKQQQFSEIPESWNGLIHPDDHMRMVQGFEALMKDQITYLSSEFRMKKKSGAWLWVLIRAIVSVRDPEGVPVRISGVLIDIDERKKTEEELKKSLREKEVLLAEVHHRVKNNLAIVSGMMQLQAFEEEEDKAKAKLLDSVTRIQSIASIHEQLYQCESLSSLQFCANLKSLITTIIHTYQTENSVELDFKLQTVLMNVNQAIPASLIVNEVISNILKHTFEKRGKCKIVTKLGQDDGMVTVTIADNGAGLPSGFNNKNKTLGLVLIDQLAKQLEASYGYEPASKGSVFTLQFKKTDAKGIGNSFL